MSTLDTVRYPLIVHPGAIQERTQLEVILNNLEKTQSAVDLVLQHLSQKPAIKSLLRAIEKEDIEISLLMASVHNKDDPSENITGETRSIRQLLDGDVSIKDRFESARMKKLWRKLRMRLHPDNLQASKEDEELFKKAKAAYKAQVYEVLYLIYRKVFPGLHGTIDNEAELLKKLTGLADQRLYTFLSGTSFDIASTYHAGGWALAEDKLHTELTLRLKALQLYRMRKNGDEPKSKYPPVKRKQVYVDTSSLIGDGGDP